MLSKKVLSFSLAAGLAFSLALNVSANYGANYEADFGEMLKIQGCVSVISKSLDMMPNSVKQSDKAKVFCANFGKFAASSSETRANLLPTLTEEFKRLCKEDPAFKQAFDEAVTGKTHASACFCANSGLSGNRNHRWTNSFH